MYSIWTWENDQLNCNLGINGVKVLGPILKDIRKYNEVSYDLCVGKS